MGRQLKRKTNSTLYEQASLRCYLLIVQAVKGSHFFSEPVFVPFIHRHDVPGVPFYFPAKERYRQPGRFPPQATEFADTMCHDQNSFTTDYKEWVKQLISKD